jgi:hypothetical protein
MKMTEEIKQEDNGVNEVEQLRQQLADAQKSIEALVGKKEELLKETKVAKEEKRKQAEAAEQARKEQLAVAEKNGEFEKLWKQEQETRTKLEQQLQQDRKERRDEKISIEAIRIANDLAKGDPDKAELLSAFVAKSLGSVADDYGRIENDVLQGVRKQFETDKKYAPLLAGNLSVGGGAPGNQRSAQKEGKEITQLEFLTMPANKQREYIVNGGVVK